MYYVMNELFFCVTPEREVPKQGRIEHAAHGPNVYHCARFTFGTKALRWHVSQRPSFNFIFLVVFANSSDAEINYLDDVVNRRDIAFQE
jgi:hypothetical protein